MYIIPHRGNTGHSLQKCKQMGYEHIHLVFQQTFPWVPTNMPEVMLGMSTKRRLGISLQRMHSLKEQTSNKMEAGNIDSSYHLILSMRLAYTGYFTGFHSNLRSAYKISIVPILNKETETKRINLWLIICSQCDRPVLISKPGCFPLYYPSVKVKCTVWLLSEHFLTYVKTVLLKDAQQKCTECL